MLFRWRADFLINEWGPRGNIYRRQTPVAMGAVKFHSLLFRLLECTLTFLMILAPTRALAHGLQFYRRGYYRLGFFFGRGSSLFAKSQYLLSRGVPAISLQEGVRLGQVGDLLTLCSRVVYNLCLA
jgi:hypothetical protein